MRNTHLLEDGGEQEALGLGGGGVERSESRRSFLKAMGAAIVGASATLLSGCGDSAQAETNNTRPTASSVDRDFEIPSEEDLRKFYIEYEKSGSIEGLEYLVPWYSKGGQIGPSLLGVSGHIQSRGLFEDMLTRYLDVFKYKRASDMQKAWKATVLPEESGRNFMPEMIAYKDGLKTVSVGNCPERGVVSKDGSTGLFALKLTDDESNLWIPEQYREKTALIVRGNASTRTNPLCITSSELVMISPEELDKLIRLHSNRDYTGLLAMAEK